MARLITVKCSQESKVNYILRVLILWNLTSLLMSLNLGLNLLSFLSISIRSLHFIFSTLSSTFRFDWLCRFGLKILVCHKKSKYVLQHCLARPTKPYATRQLALNWLSYTSFCTTNLLNINDISPPNAEHLDIWCGRNSSCNSGCIVWQGHQISFKLER